MGADDNINQRHKVVIKIDMFFFMYEKAKWYVKKKW